MCPRRGTLPAVLTRVSHRALPSSDGLLARCSILLKATTGKTKRNQGAQLETAIPEQIYGGDAASGPYLCCSGKSAPGKLHQHGAQHFVRNSQGMACIPTNLKGAQLNLATHLAANVTTRQTCKAKCPVCTKLDCMALLMPCRCVTPRQTCRAKCPVCTKLDWVAILMPSCASSAGKAAPA